MPGSSSWMPYAPQGVKGFNELMHGTRNISKSYSIVVVIVLSHNIMFASFLSLAIKSCVI